MKRLLLLTFTVVFLFTLVSCDDSVANHNTAARLETNRELSTNEGSLSKSTKNEPITTLKPTDKNKIGPDFSFIDFIKDRFSYNLTSDDIKNDGSTRIVELDTNNKSLREIIVTEKTMMDKLNLYRDKFISSTRNEKLYNEINQNDSYHLNHIVLFDDGTYVVIGDRDNGVMGRSLDKLN